MDQDSSSSSDDEPFECDLLDLMDALEDEQPLAEQVAPAPIDEAEPAPAEATLPELPSPPVEPAPGVPESRLQQLLSELQCSQRNQLPDLGGLAELAQLTQDEKGAAEVRDCGGVALLVWAAKAAVDRGDEESIALAGAVIANCAGQNSRGAREVQYCFGGSDFTISEAAYVDGGLGFKVWPAALSLCRQISSCKAQLQGKPVLEISCGLGLPGLVAAELGAGQVFLSENHPEMLRLASVNAEKNKLAHKTKAVYFNWKDLIEADSSANALCDSDAYNPLEGCDSRPDQASCCGNTLLIPQREPGVVVEMPRPELIIGATVVYDVEHGTLLPEALNTILAPRGLIILANHTTHDGHQVFRQQMQQLGFVAVHEAFEEVGDVDSGHATDELVHVASYMRVGEM